MPEFTNYNGNELRDKRLDSNPLFTKAAGGYVSVGGFTLPGNYVERAEEIENLEVYDDDIWICTFPKSGTTWTQEMVWLLMNDFDYQKAKKPLYERFIFLDDVFIIDFKKLPQNELTSCISKNKPDAIRAINRMKRPRYIKTHLPFQLLPRQIRNGTRNPKMICVTRNPKDVCVSYYHHYRLLFGYRGTLQEFIELFLEGKVIYGPYWNNVLPFLERRNDSNYLVFSYEEMKQDLSIVVDQVASFLGKKVPDDQMNVLLKHLDFESMKKNPTLNCEDVGPVLKTIFQVKCDESFIRKGKVGSYKEEMPEKSIHKFDSWIRENLKRVELCF